jgi:Ca2+-binding RTX toxin-like protein
MAKKPAKPLPPRYLSIYPGNPPTAARGHPPIGCSAAIVRKDTEMKLRFLVLTTLATVALAAPAGVAVAKPKAPTCDGLTATIVGTKGDDTLAGTTGPDVIVGLGGDDTIVGDLGADVICGGTGDDTLSGHGDNDRLFGEQGNDALDGGVGGCCADVPANSGDDYLSGGQGNDVLDTSDFPTTGSTLYGDQGADVINVWSGGAAYGGSGKDELNQYAGTTTLEGGNGRDTLTNGDDLSVDAVTLVGGRGGDTLVNDDATGTTDMDGGQGPDTCTAGTTATGCEA